MQSEDYQKIKKYSQMQKEGELRQYSSDGSMPFLSLESWGAAGREGGSTSFYLYKDGEFVKREDKSVLLPEFKYKDMDVEKVSQEINIYYLNLTKEKVEEIVNFLDENVKESKSQMIFDAGWTVIYLKEDKRIEIENDQELYLKVKEMLPHDIGE